jgi:hypothetical protein
MDCSSFPAMPVPEVSSRAARHLLFGTVVSSDFAFTSHLIPSSAVPDLTFTVSGAAWDPAGWEIVYRSDRIESDGEAAATLFRRGGLQVLRFAGEATFQLSHDRITVGIDDAGSKRFSELAFLGPVMALWLELAGVATLHASAVEVPGGAIVFLGGQGSRKTSCAAAMLHHSHRLLADDLVALEQIEDRFVCRPGYPEMRMWPREADFFVSPPQPAVPVMAGSAKRRIRVGERGFGGFSAENTEVLRLYLLSPETEDEVTIRPLRASPAVIAMVGGSSVPSLTAALDLDAPRLRTLGNIASSVPIAEARFPAGPEGAVALAEAVLAEVS